MKLNSRETELLGLVAKGMTQAEIAASQGKTVSHTSTTLSSLYKKLNAKNAPHGVAKGVSEGLIPLPDIDAAIVLLAYRGMRKPEIATMLGCSDQDVERRIRYAIALLNKFI